MFRVPRVAVPYDALEDGELPRVYVLATGLAGLVRAENIVAFAELGSLTERDDGTPWYQGDGYRVVRHAATGSEYHVYTDAEHVPAWRIPAICALVLDAQTRSRLHAAESAILARVPTARVIVLVEPGAVKNAFRGTERVTFVEIAKEAPSAVKLAAAHFTVLLGTYEAALT